MREIGLQLGALIRRDAYDRDALETVLRLRQEGDAVSRRFRPRSRRTHAKRVEDRLIAACLSVR